MAMAFHPSGRSLACGCVTGQGSVTVHDLESGKETHRLPPHANEVLSVTVKPGPSPDELISVKAGAFACRWTIASGQESVLFKMPGDDPLVRYSPDGRLVASGDRRGFPKLWDTQTGKPVQIFLGHKERARDVCFSPDGSKLLTGSLDKTARLWDAAEGREIRSFEQHTAPVAGVAFSPDGKLAASCGSSAEGYVRVWEAASGREVGRVRPGDGRAPLRVAFARDLRAFAVGDDGGRLTVWDLETFEMEHQVHAHEGRPGVSALAYSPAAPLLATGGRRGIVQLWSTKTFSKIQSLRANRQCVTDLSFSSDGSLLASSGWGGQVCVWRAGSAGERR